MFNGSLGDVKTKWVQQTTYVSLPEGICKAKHFIGILL